jgi:PAS domain S-box-containing protein
VASGPTRPGSPDEFGATGTEVQDDGYAAVFWTAFQRSANPMVLTDLDRRIVAVNEAAARVSARAVEALVGLPFTDLLDDPAEALDDDAWRERVVAGESYGHRCIRRPDGSTLIVDFAMRAARVDGRVLVLGVGLHIAPEHESNTVHAPAALTPREREIVHLIALGRVTREICAELHVAPDTVRTHVRNAMAKTGARTRAQLIAIALGDGLLEG